MKERIERCKAEWRLFKFLFGVVFESLPLAVSSFTRAFKFYRHARMVMLEERADAFKRRELGI